MNSSASHDPAAAEPFFSVLTHDEFRSAVITPQAIERFYRSGEQHVQAVVDFIASQIDPHFAAETVLEYGCGPGRLALPFARRAEKVVAVDRSPAMLARAAEMAARADLANIHFVTPGELAKLEGKFDLVSCHLVLQRLEHREGLALLRMLLQRVRTIGVFHLPVVDRTSPVTRLLRWSRASLPGVNAAVNVARRQSAATPFQRTTVYDLAEVLAVAKEAGFDAPIVVTRNEGDFDAATIYVHREGSQDERPAKRSTAAPGGAPAAATEFIDVRELIARTSIEELNATAEAYFSSLKEWDHHITKPFSKPDETPAILINFAVLLQGMKLEPGLTVLDYGAGTGWLSRIVTQLGCRAILLDVSESALRIARETFTRIPVIGDRPAPSFLHFDGRRIDLPDQSVDRIICFDAFHHAPNPDQIIAEFARILRPGGIAGFAEPGPQHSQTAQSQFEMRTYGVLENDIDLPAIWRAAHVAGFRDVRVAAWTSEPFHTSLAGYEDLLAGGTTFEVWSQTSRNNLHRVRNFFLFKGGDSTEMDSRHPEGLIADIVAAVSGPKELTVTVTNTGDAIWLPSGSGAGAVSLGAHLYDDNGSLRKFDFGRVALSDRPMKPNDSVTVRMELDELEPGRHRIELDCVAEHVIWFTQVGSRTRVVHLDVPAGRRD